MASNDDEAVGGEIYSLLFKHKVLTNNEIAGKLEKSPGCVHRCLDMLEKESLVRRIKVFGGNHKWQLNDGSENSSGYYSDLQDEDSVLSLKSIASSLDEIEDTSLTPVKQGPSLCQRGQQNSEPLSQTTYNVWSCPSCTFLNEQNMRTCKMCGTAKLEGSSLPDFKEQTNLKSLQTHSLDSEETGQKLVNSENPIRSSSLPGFREPTNLKSLQTHSLDMEETSQKLVNSENPIRGDSLPGLREQTNLKSLQIHSLDMEETSPKFVNSENPIRDICTPTRLREQTIPKCIQPPMLKKEVGGITLFTSSEIKKMKMETVDPGIKPYLDILQTIVKFFSDPANKNLKPADVAKKCKIGQTKKDANNYLYHLEKKGVLKRTSDDGNKDPRWSAEPGALSAVTQRNFLEWAAELSKKPKGKNPGIKSKPEEVDPEVHYHHHHHHLHKNFLQVGNNTEMQICQIKDALADRERVAEGDSESKVKVI